MQNNQSTDDLYNKYVSLCTKLKRTVLPFENRLDWLKHYYNISMHKNW